MNAQSMSHSVFLKSLQIYFRLLEEGGLTNLRIDVSNILEEQQGVPQTQGLENHVDPLKESLSMQL